ncbi:type I restriction enzyme S subunit [Bradyrhizobium sp. USDA 3686]|uniref:restriction endonuclease subunit S n=1 Tax=Bradyrhizobium canariense TaxID=255045 RepID=UPI00195D50B2|nr:restriction endonuclease subunit S [Bradyrhizobium canariense]MBM7482670.1 type I restriction enzyme S subunit [Bradyrhizobium canariense]
MIDVLRPYPETKASGLAWLGDVPAHWDVRRNGRLFGSRREMGFPNLPVLQVSLRSGVRIRDFDNGERKQEIGDRSKYQRAVRGDIAYNMMRMWQGAVGIVPADGLVSPAYVVARPFAEADAGYYAYLFRTAAYMREVDTFSRGIVPDRNRLYWESFKQMPSVYPPLDEQRLIVRFLDWHGAQTAKLIGAKKKIIALLNEQKQAIIHRAVTRGLDPNVKLKPSGISWLGDVPEGWDVAALRHRYDQCLGKMLDTKRITGAYLVPYLRNTDVQWERINVINLPLMDVPPAEYARYCVRLGDLLVCEGGEIGRAAIWSNALELCAFQKALHRLRPRNLKRDNPQFLLLQLRLAVALGAFVDGHESTIAHLTGEKLRAHRFVFPSLVEQQRIISHIETQSLEINAAADRVEREIALIQEFRTRLIADVVTGKLDVRAAAASLPEVAELEATDDLAEGDDLDEVIDDAESEEVAA